MKFNLRHSDLRFLIDEEAPPSCDDCGEPLGSKATVLDQGRVLHQSCWQKLQEELAEEEEGC